MKNNVVGLMALFLFECLMAQNAQKSGVMPLDLGVAAALPRPPMIVELEDILLVQGLAAATTKLQNVINVADGLREGVQPAVVKKSQKAAAAQAAPALVPAPKTGAAEQEAMAVFLQQYAQVLESFIPQGDATTVTPALLDQGVMCLVDIARTSLLNDKGKESLIKTLLPKFKVRALNAIEIAAWEAIRPMFAPYQQKGSGVVYFHPLQEEAVNALQSALVQCKDKKTHYSMVKRLQDAIEMLVGTMLLRRQQVTAPMLAKLASLEQVQQLATAIAENEILSAEIKVTAKTTLESLVSVMGNIRAATTMTTSQLAADQGAPVLAKITNAGGYMNKFDALFKGLNVSSDAYVDDGMQKLRNAFAQSLVDLQKKVVPEVAASCAALLRRATESGLLGVAQRTYVRMTMLPALDSESTKNARVAAMKRVGKPTAVVAKKKTKK